MDSTKEIETQKTIIVFKKFKKKRLEKETLHFFKRNKLTLNQWDKRKLKRKKEKTHKNKCNDIFCALHFDKIFVLYHVLSMHATHATICFFSSYLLVLKIKFTSKRFARFLRFKQTKHAFSYYFSLIGTILTYTNTLFQAIICLSHFPHIRPSVVHQLYQYFSL